MAVSPPRRFFPALLGCALLGCVCDGRGSAAAAGDAPAAAWRGLGTGLAYRLLDADGTQYHLVRIDLETHEIRIADARREGRKVATVEVLAQESQALAAINGTFFDEEQRPLGLLVSEGRELNPLREVSWWAALAIRDAAPNPYAEILTTSQLAELTPDQRAHLRFALQVGPRTVVQGRVVKLKKQTAARSAVCVTRPGELLLVATEGAPVESNELAARMVGAVGGGGFGCSSGLMLDGGPSTQLHVDAGGLRLAVRGGWDVPNAIVVVPRVVRPSRR